MAERGRPSSYTTAIATRICNRIIDGESLRAICEDADMPNKTTVLRWVANEQFAEFRAQYAHARELSSESDADDVAHYAHMAARGEIDPAAARAAMDGLKWSAGKRNPKKYGEKLALTGGDPETDNPIQVSDRERAKALAALIAQAKKG